MTNPADELARFRIDGRVAAVSGGTGAIGRRLSLALAGVGAKVAILGRSAGDYQGWSCSWMSTTWPLARLTNIVNRRSVGAVVSLRSYVRETTSARS